MRRADSPCSPDTCAPHFFLPVERYLQDAKLCEMGEGTSQVQRLVIARHVLKEAKPVKLAHREPRNPNR